MPCTASEYSKFAYFFNHVPLRSILSDTERYPSFAQLDAAATVEGLGLIRSTSMGRARGCVRWS